MEDNEDFILKNINTFDELLESGILEKPYGNIKNSEFPDVLYKFASILYGEENVDVFFRVQTINKETGALSYIEYVPINKITELYENNKTRNIFLDLLIKFDKVLIENIQGRQHLMTDFYVRFKFCFLEEDSHPEGNLYNLFGIESIRLSATPLEIYKGYSFSHQSNSPGNWGNLCTGSGDFGNSINLLYLNSLFTEWKIKDLFTPIYLLEGYVSWESLDGGPYKRLSSLYAKETQEVDKYFRSGIYKDTSLEFANKLMKQEFFVDLFYKYKIMDRYNIRGIVSEFSSQLKNEEIINQLFNIYIEICDYANKDNPELEEQVLNYTIKDKIEVLYKTMFLSKYDLSSFYIILEKNENSISITIPETIITFKGEPVIFKLIYEDKKEEKVEHDFSLGLVIIYMMIKQFMEKDRIDYIKKELNK